MAILLNFMINDAGYARDECGVAPIKRLRQRDVILREILREQLRLAGVEQDLEISAQPGPIFHGETIIYRDGKASYVGLLRDHTAPVAEQQLKVSFSKPEYIYDVLAGEYLGKTAEIDLNLASGRIGLYALLPYRVTELGVNVGKSYRPGDRVDIKATLRATTKRIGRHVIHFELLNPQGVLVRHYAQNIVADNGRAKASIQLALSDMPGQWTVKATDVASGTKMAANFQIQE